MTYREPDPEAQAAEDRRAAAEAKLEDAAAVGREARGQGAVEPAIKAGGQRGMGARLATVMVPTVGGMAGALALGASVPVMMVGGVVGLVAGTGALALGFSLQAARERRWLSKVPFAVRGYVEVVTAPGVVCALRTTITLAAIEPEDRERVLEMLGAVDAEAPTVTVADRTITIEGLVADNRRTLRRYLRGMIEKVGVPLHASRRVLLIQFVSTNAPIDGPADIYGAY